MGQRLNKVPTKAFSGEMTFGLGLLLNSLLEMVCVRVGRRGWDR